YLDLDHLDDFEGTRLQINRPGILSFKTDRHLCDDNQPSGDFVRHLVTKQLDVDVSGPVKLLTNPHCFGVGFNPLSVYFLHQASGSPAALIYEVSNTPWNEIHRYVIPYERVSSGQEYWFDKTFHVSPFNPTTQRYVTRVEWPTDGRLYSAEFTVKRSRYGAKASPTTHTLKERYDANNDRNKVFNRPRVKGSDNRPKARSQRITQSVFKSPLRSINNCRW
ncbi:MAG: DUF1365 family protein, partial [Gammaproteobacteria bacterium]|nr:DUF1365 family protein [Gammaproteobacteria bacterium]